MEKKVIVITGASSGIGFDSAKELLAQGHMVYGAARRTELMEPIVRAGGKALFMDVTEQETVDQAIKTVIKEQGRIDTLFLNAGYALQGPVELVEIEDAKAQYDTNVFGTARVLKAALPHMRKIKKGHIIVTSSAAGSVTMPGMAWYPSTKHALDALIGGLRMEMKDFGIHVSIVEPGYVNTEFINPARETMDKLDKTLKDPIYKAQQAALRKNFQKSIETADKVETITKIVVRAVNDRSPKKYYTAGQAKLAKFLKRTFGYGLLDSYMINTSIK